MTARAEGRGNGYGVRRARRRFLGRVTESMGTRAGKTAGAGKRLRGRVTERGHEDAGGKDGGRGETAAGAGDGERA